MSPAYAGGRSFQYFSHAGWPVPYLDRVGRMRGFDAVCRLGMFLGDASELLFEQLQLLFGKIFEHHEIVASAFHGANQFIEFEVDRFGVAVLHVLDEEHHEKGDDGGAGVDDQLPAI